MLKNKKFIFSFISTLLIVTTVFAPVAYASNPYNNVWKSSPASVQKFNESISHLYPKKTPALSLRMMSLYLL